MTEKKILIDDEGLSTKEAINKLKSAIKDELENEQMSNSVHYLPSWVKEAFHHNSNYSTFPWTSATLLCINILILILYRVYGDQNFRMKSISAEIFFLILFLLMNALIVAWDSMLRHTEMASRIRSVLNILEEEGYLALGVMWPWSVLDTIECPLYESVRTEGSSDNLTKNQNLVWDFGQYSSLHTPQSPCISAQWTYRDGHLLNLPSSLLVEGDLILMRPGHAAPGQCISITKHQSSHCQLSRGQIFAPANEHLSESFNSPRLRIPAHTAKFVMLETPCVKSVRLAIQKSLNRPVTLFSKEYHAVVFYYLEKIILPVALFVVVCIGSIHAAYFKYESSEWTEHLLLRPVLVVLPLLPIALPTCWVLLNVLGNSYLLGFFNSSKIAVKPVDPFDEIEEVSPPLLDRSVKWSDLKYFFFSLLFSRDGYLWRSANLLQILGSVTALCCVDKKGILSWPNPSAEKVFFLKSPKSKSTSEDSTQMCDSGDASQELHDIQCLNEDVLEIKRITKINKRLDVKDHIYHPGSQVEVLDLTHNAHSPFGVQFDDPNWKFYIGNLKPLGLGILLNTCNPRAQEHYTQFSDHIASESLYNDAAVPVVNKRCLCELAKQIGFSDSVVDFYNLEQQLGIFRHVHPEVIQKGKLARSLNFPRLKMPFPNISCAVVKDLHRGSHQLFSQGTADLVLDACNEYWDGDDIRLLTDSDRKRILDFYHRSSLTAHCMGYAYSPLNNSLNNNFSEAYIELPAEGYHLFSALKTTTSSPRSWDPPFFDGCSRQQSLNRYLSSDSLILPDQNEKVEEWYNDSSSCLHQLGNEIFIGMVTMQYQACPDFVQLIEQLDKACIRFVHFSKENELRSRVFSEKMGLESGWNCHISLLSDDSNSKPRKESQTVSPLTFSRHYAFSGTLDDASTMETRSENPTRHASAPSVVNLEVNTVKFEESSIDSRSECSASENNTISSKLHVGMESMFPSSENEFRHKKSVSSVQDIFVIDENNLSHSPSHVTESTEQSAPVTFDMSNRAKLPKGTENIRPHIENVDNVPLQVSLFTDCTAEATREMICIMQEYGEVVCCLGSSANMENMPIFLQADASIAIEPLHPQLCMQQPVFEYVPNQRLFGPTHLSSILNSLPCGLCFHREEPISLFHLIMEARHFMCCVQDGLQFMLCCYLSITLLHVIAVVFFMPLPLPLAHMLWMICLQIPLLSLSLLGNPVDAHVMTLATGKNLKAANKQTLVYFALCYGAKFCPSVIVAILSFALTMSSFCESILKSDSRICWVFLDFEEENVHSESWISALTIGQNIISFFLVVCFVLISMNFVHRSHVLWRSNPFANKYWVLTAILVICLQLVFNITDIAINIGETVKSVSILDQIPYYVWLLCGVWLIIVIPLNELMKRHESKVNVRQQKRARLEFCTKLGMNSPF